MLLDPLEEQLDLPVVLTALGDDVGRVDEVVGNEHQRSIVFGPRHGDTAQEFAVVVLATTARALHPASVLVHHSDRGAQYCSHEYQGLVKQFGLRPSMSRQGNCYDKVPRMESF